MIESSGEKINSQGLRFLVLKKIVQIEVAAKGLRKNLATKSQSYLLDSGCQYVYKK